MLASLHRFHGLNSLSFAYRQGQTVRGAQLSLKYALNRRRQTYRVAVVVSRKVDKSAVVRNRIRRRVYEVVRLNATGMDAPYDLIFTAFSSQLVELEPSKLEQLVVEQLQRAGALTPKNHATHAIVKSEE
jgi:ribonuclease P protein component